MARELLSTTSIQLIVLFMATLLVLPKLTLCIDPRYLACSNPKVKTCGDGQNISFPFHIQDKQDPFCGYPGFKLFCNENGHPILTLSNNDYVIHDIFYKNQSLRVSNVDVFNRNDSCAPPFHNLSLPNEGFQPPPKHRELFLLYNCNLTLLDSTLLKYKVNCSLERRLSLESSEYYADSMLAVLGEDPYLSYVSWMCKDSVVVPVDVNGSESNGGISAIQGLDRGFLMNWVSSNCSQCEESGGRCGFDNATYIFQCFCPDQPHPLYCPSGHLKNSRIKAGIGASVSGLGVVILVICCLLWRKMSSSYPIFRLKRKTEEDRSIESFLSKHGPLTIKRYCYSEIKKITESFRDKLGEGGYGGVFKGKLPDGRLVAVKLLKESKPSGEEFANEVASIGRTSHVNIVTLLGFCFEGSKRALLYEFMPNGSLEKYIQQGPSQLDHQLGWETLYQIAIGIAQGLEYLHKGCKTRILHFDIKPHNILLDENLCPKISDFGLAKICPQRESIISMLGARGTAGYIAPEVFCRNFGGVSHKSDVYSYGMMVLEMVGGRKNISEQVNNSSEKYFPDWIYKRLELGEELGVHQIRNEDESQLARRMIIVSLWCIQTKPADRPPISRVIEMLQGSFQPLIIPPRPTLSSPPRSPKRSDPSTSSTSTTDS